MAQKKVTLTNKVLDTDNITMTCAYKGYNGHKGVDLKPTSSKETPDVCAFADGVVFHIGNIKGVIKTTDIRGCGTYVTVKHADGTLTRYQHGKYNSIKVKEGEKVKKGQALMKFGRPTTGNSTGPHLHFDLSYPTKPSEDYIKSSFFGETRYYVDPLPYLQGKKTTTPKKTTTQAATKKKYKVTATWLNVRRGPGTTYGVSTSIKNGTVVTVYETKGNWSRIGENKWVYNKYLKEV